MHDPTRAAWIDNASLLTNRTIRNYLDRYNPSMWAEVTKLTVLYGIIALQQQHPDHALTLQQLKQAVGASATAQVVQKNVPALQRQILTLQSELDSVFDKLSLELLPGPASKTPEQEQHTLLAVSQPQDAPETYKQHNAQHQNQQQQQRTVSWQVQEQSTMPNIPASVPATAAAIKSTSGMTFGRRSRARSPIIAQKPSHAWRQGEPSGYASPSRSHLTRSQDNQGATNPIYPGWWQKAPVHAQPAQQQQQLQATRHQPKLAYSLPPQWDQQAITDDDLVTAQYLLVPGSGYNKQQWHMQQHHEQHNKHPPWHVADFSHTHITADDISQQAPVHPATCGPSQGCQDSALRMQGTGVAPAERGRTRLRNVQTKVKRHILASKHEAALQQRQQQQAVVAVVAGSLNGDNQPDRVQSQPAADCPPAAAAEQFIANPWASWFVPDAAADLSVARAAARITAEEDAQQDSQQADSLSALGSEQMLSSYATTNVTAAGAAALLHADSAHSILQDISDTVNRVSSNHSSSSHSSLKGAFAALVTTPDLSIMRPMQPLSPVASRNAANKLPMRVARLHQAWAADFGHLDGAQLAAGAAVGSSTDAAGGIAARRPASQRQQWSQNWVGDFGHLLERARFSKETAFSHNQQHECQAQDDTTKPAAASSLSGINSRGFLMPPAHFEDFAAAAEVMGASAALQGSTSAEAAPPTVAAVQIGDVDASLARLMQGQLWQEQSEEPEDMLLFAGTSSRGHTVHATAVVSGPVVGLASSQADSQHSLGSLEY